jgi:hypothetical protein
MMGSLILLAGCGLLNKTHKMASSSENTKQTIRKDSTAYSEKLIKQDVQVPGESTTVKGKIDISGGKIKDTDLQSKGSKSSIKVHIDSSGLVTAKCDCHTYKTQVYALDKELTRYKSQTQLKVEKKTEVKTIKKEVRFIPWYAKVAEWISIITLLYLTYRLYKFIQRNKLFI